MAGWRALLSSDEALGDVMREVAHKQLHAVGVCHQGRTRVHFLGQLKHFSGIFSGMSCANRISVCDENAAPGAGEGWSSVSILVAAKLAY